MRLISGRYGSRAKNAGTIDEINGKQNISKKKLQKNWHRRAFVPWRIGFLTTTTPKSALIPPKIFALHLPSTESAHFDCLQANVGFALSKRYPIRQPAPHRDEQAPVVGWV
ncbi:hypothetical protein [uncultured Marivita sp.]|uniref:hypothetical protein n=1 Tax=uncultured Marivita sp. TaxID=888080 RepID=UPI0026091171|nr:hypothetical protein [uncultured Marivita sp.]